MNAASEDSEKLAEFLEFETGERLGKGVRNHVVSRAIDERDVTLRDSLTNKMEVDINMFCATVKGGIL